MKNPLELRRLLPLVAALVFVLAPSIRAEPEPEPVPPVPPAGEKPPAEKDDPGGITEIPDGRGGPGWYLPAERPVKVVPRGALCRARGAHPDSAGSQWFIAVGEVEAI